MAQVIPLVKPLVKPLIAKLVNAASLMLAVVALNFALIRAAPGDPAEVIAGQMGGADERILQEIRLRYGLDRPMPAQLWAYLGRMTRGDLGWSYYFDRPVAELILRRLPPTALLMAVSLSLAALIGVSLGAAAACRPRSRLCRALGLMSLAGYASPVFWTGLMLLLLFARLWPIFPINGMRDVVNVKTGLALALDVGRHLALPCLTLVLLNSVQFSRLVRASLAEVLAQDYVRTARAKGLSEFAVLRRHALPNALLPAITMVGLQFGPMLAGAVVVETVFGWPGLGRLIFDSILRRDYQVLLGVLFLSAVMVVLVNLAVDLAYRLVDPRLRDGGDEAAAGPPADPAASGDCGPPSRPGRTATPPRSPSVSPGASPDRPPVASSGPSPDSRAVASPETSPDRPKPPDASSAPSPDSRAASEVTPPEASRNGPPKEAASPEASSDGPAKRGRPAGATTIRLETPDSFGGRSLSVSAPQAAETGRREPPNDGGEAEKADDQFGRGPGDRPGDRPDEGEDVEAFGGLGPAVSRPEPAWSPTREFLAEFASNRTGLAGLALLAIMALAVTAGPSIRGLDPFDIVSAPFMPPDRATPFGADYVGRDVLAGTLHGGRASLAVGLSAAALTAAIGLTVGVLGGWFGGKLDAVLTKTTEFFQVLPTLLFAMVLVSVFSPSLRTVALAIGATSWMNVARLARAEMMRLKNLDFVSSAAASGASGLYVMTRVALPNALPPIIVQAAFDVSWAILLEGSLSYLGLGDPNRMSWGLIIGQNKNYVLDAWWTVVFPGAAIFLSVLGVCLAGDALNDALNPRLRRR